MAVPSLIAIAVMLAVGYVWSSRGFFSAFLNLMVTIASGAVAFGLWETVSQMVMKNTTSSFLIDILSGGTLVALFVVAMAVISLTTNAVVRANIKVPKVVDWIGGAVCGLGAGVIVSGITMIGTSQIRTAEIDNIIQFNPVSYANDGYLTREQMWVPTDTWTAAIYNYWSDRSLRETFGGGKTMAAWRPNVADEGHLLRVAETDVLLRYSLNPKDVKLGGRYTVGRDRPKNPPKGYTAPTVKDLVGDVKKVETLDGRSFKNGAYIEGFVVGFDAGAKEKGGQVAIGSGSATLICRNKSDDRSIALQPIAVVSQAKGDSLAEGRGASTPKTSSSAPSAGRPRRRWPLSSSCPTRTSTTRRRCGTPSRSMSAACGSTSPIPTSPKRPSTRCGNTSPLRSAPTRSRRARSSATRSTRRSPSPTRPSGSSTTPRTPTLRSA
ncbi:MAG: CvpA family protein [Phycisphaerales bacterium]